nr:probable protein phosphatase 2C 34 [Ipomoea trifida]
MSFQITERQLVKDRTLSVRKGRSNSEDGGRAAVESMAKMAKKNDLILRSSGAINVDGFRNFASVFSKRGEKCINQDCFIVWEELSSGGVDI